MPSPDLRRSQKLDALYIRHHFPICLVVYFCLSFSMLRIVSDLTGAPSSALEIYGIPAAFTVIFGIVLRRWAEKKVRELGLEDFS